MCCTSSIFWKGIMQFCLENLSDQWKWLFQLATLFPGFRLALPPKKWFGDNFDPDFLEDRTLGLQAFINNITGHKDVCNRWEVKWFYCVNTSASDQHFVVIKTLRMCYPLMMRICVDFIIIKHLHLLFQSSSARFLLFRWPSRATW